MAAGTPVVFLDRPGGGLEADAVLIDNRGGAHAAVAELLRDGHERIALLFDSPSIFTMAERRQGFLDAFAEAGRTPDPALLVSDLHTPAAAREAMERLLESEHAPTAVFCANNRSTIGALEAILPRDVDVAVTGFDDFELAQVLPRRIRIVDYDTDRLGTVTAETLFARIDGSAGSSRFLLPTRLVDRGGYGR
ncbi:LacI family transcriptional regulator [Microbacterium lushaniae]|nr:LacI family transcriptional regulator [Microbacterium lushaniae]